MPAWEQFAIQAGTQAAGQITGGAMGLLLGGVERKKQIEQQKKLQALQIQGQKEMSEYNFAKQMQLWQETGYAAQKKQMEEAGLNPALMYGMGGGGGQTTSIQPGNVTGAQARQGGEAAAMAMQMGDAALKAAQIELMKAEANKANAEAGNVPKTGENIEASTQLILQNIQNAKSQQDYTEAMSAWQKLETQFAQQTYGNRQEQIEQLLNETIAKVKQIGLANNFTEETWKAAVDIIEKNAVQAELHNQLLKAQKQATEKGMQLTDAQISTMADQAAQGWAKINLETIQGQRETVKLAQTDVSLALQEMKQKFEETHPGLWNVIGGTIEEEIKRTVDQIREKMKKLVPKL